MRRFKLYFKWFDFWIGIFVDTKKGYLYIQPLPMIGIRLHRHKMTGTAIRPIRGWCGCKEWIRI